MAMLSALAIGVVRKITWGGDPGAAQRTTHDITFKQRFDQLQNVVDPMLAAIREKPPTPPRRNLFNGRSNDPSKLVALKHVAQQLQEQMAVPLAEVIDVYYERRISFIAAIKRHFYGDIDDSVQLHAKLIKNELMKELPLVAVPYRVPGQAGKRPLLLLRDMPSLDDAELEESLQPVLELLRLKEERKMMGASLSPEDYKLLQRSMPSEISAVTDALIVKFGGASAAAALGIGDGRAARAVERLDVLVHETLPQAMVRARQMALEMISKRSGVADEMITTKARSITTWQLRKMVADEGLLRDRHLATEQTLLAQVPELLDILRDCAMVSSGAVFKERCETPVDQILLEQTMRGQGGQERRMQLILNGVLAARNLSVSIGTVDALLKQANIKALAVKHTLNPPKVGKHYCCAEILTHRQVAHLFSAHCVRLSIDQKANLKSNSDHNTAEGGNRKKFQVSSERTITYSHGAGGDHLAKYGLFSMLVLPVRKEQREALGLANLDISEIVSSYKESEAFFERPGLAYVLGHCQSIEPENAFRDAADVAELIEARPEYFLTPDLDLVPFVILEKDNSHGVQDVSCRFAFTVLSLLYDLDYLSIGSQEAGYSMLHQVESMNGALSRRLNGAPFTLDLAAPDKASPEELHTAEKAVLKEICKRANGFTYKTGGGFGEVREARSTKIASGFEWRPVEMAAFIEAAKKGEANSFIATTLKSMDGYSGDYGKLLMRAWQLLNATGSLQCTKTSQHTFHVWKNALNPNCSVRRGPDSFFDFLDLFGGTIPQPKRSVLRPFVDSKKDAGHYMDLTERCSTTGRGATGLDEFYPKTILDARLEDGTLSLIDSFLDGDNALPNQLRDELCEEMCVDEATLYAELIERIAKAEYSIKYKALVANQKSDGTADIVATIAYSVYNSSSDLTKPANAPPSWPRVAELKEVTKKLKIKHDKAAKKATLIAAIHSYWLALPAARKDALCSPQQATRTQQPQLRLQPAVNPATQQPQLRLQPAVNPAPVAAVAVAVAAVLKRDRAAALAAGQQAAAAAALFGAPTAAARATEVAEVAGVVVEETGEEAAEATALEAVVEAAALEEEEEEEAAEEEARVEQAAVVGLVDSLLQTKWQECAACTPACGERFPEPTMTTTRKGFARQWACCNEEECLERVLGRAGDRSGRKRGRG